MSTSCDTDPAWVDAKPFVILVGQGVFGISIAEALLEAGCRVRWIHARETCFASNGEARLVRSAYTDENYKAWGKQAFTAFETKTPYKQHFRKVGWFVVRCEGQTDGASISTSGKAVSAEDFKKSFPGADLNRTWTMTKSDDVGVVEAAALCQTLIDQLRAKYKDALEVIDNRVTGLIMENNECRGVRLLEPHKEGGSEICGDQVMLAVGWQTNELLRDSEIEVVDYAVVGVATLAFRLNEGAKHLLSNPVLCVDGHGEVIPVLDANMVIVNSHVSWNCSKNHPPHNPAADHACFFDVWEFIQKFCPELKHCKVAFAQMTCDAFTPSQTPFAVNAAKNLWACGGGSFHFFKFLPVLKFAIAGALGIPLSKGSSLWENVTDRTTRKHKGLKPRADRVWPPNQD